MYCYKCHEECNDIIEDENLVSDCCGDIVTFDPEGIEVATYDDYMEYLREQIADAKREDYMLESYLKENLDA